ncbi:MAG: sn-glycerol-3-phosphate ABC transporter ATP-binding protein UgpC [Candidatus Saccharibacteria bacterium]|nr:sn-glycerol-3-phosphate ABC transporter ATP-binding protein UgpC [Rhodoferax sp.]
MAELSLRQVRKSFPGGIEVLRGIDLQVADGEFIVFVGPSGCGKSTLLRVMAGLETMTDGDLSIGGQSVRDLAPAERGVAMVFQSYALYPHMSVAQNMGFGLKMSGVPKAVVAKKVGEVAEVLQLTHLLDSKPGVLSGGQRQRVAIGRAIVRTPKVFLFDEPLSNLDASLRVQMRLELARLHKALGTTMIYVTHDQVEAMTLGQRIAVFNGGRLEQVGTPQTLFNQPANQFVAGFLGSPRMNFIPVQAIQASIEANPWCVPKSVTRDCVIGIRPEDFILVSAESGMRASIDMVENLGDVVIAYATLSGQPASIAMKLAAAGCTLQPGDVVGLKVNPGKMYVFNQYGVALGPCNPV